MELPSEVPRAGGAGQPPVQCSAHNAAGGDNPPKRMRLGDRWCYHITQNRWDDGRFAPRTGREPGTRFVPDQQTLFPI